MTFKRTFFIVILSLACTLGLLHYYGDSLETGLRNYYREEICQCDTLRYQITYDSLGIPFVDYHSVIGFYVGVQRNATVVGKTALDEYYEPAAQGDEKKKELFINCADWLVNNATCYACPDTICDSMAVLEYSFASYYDMQPPWRSAMTQGKALEVMAKAHNLTGDKRYVEVANKLLNTFFIAAKSGGVTYKTDNEGWWYEEYARINGKKPMVLNGMMYSVLSLNDYYQRTNDPAAQFLFRQGIAALKHNLPNYDMDGYSYYDALGNVAQPQYHLVHVRLLERLLDVTSDPVLKKYYELWGRYREPSYLVNRLWTPNKTAFLLFAVAFVCFFLIIRAVIK